VSAKVFYGKRKGVVDVYTRTRQPSKHLQKVTSRYNVETVYVLYQGSFQFKRHRICICICMWVFVIPTTWCYVMTAMNTNFQQSRWRAHWLHLNPLLCLSMILWLLWRWWNVKCYTSSRINALSCLLTVMCPFAATFITTQSLKKLKICCLNYCHTTAYCTLRCKTATDLTKVCLDVNLQSPSALLTWTVSHQLVLSMYTVSQKTVQNCLSELRQISTNSDNFWQRDCKEAKIMRDILIFHLT